MGYLTSKKTLLLVIFLISIFTATLSSVKIYGTVYDIEKSKLANVKLNVQVGDTVLYDTTVALGNYEFDVPRGSFFLVAEKSGYPKWIGKLNVEKDMKFDIIMVKRSGYYLYGRFFGDGEGVSIDLYQNNRRVAKDSTTNNGLFLFSGLPKGLYELRITTSKYNISQPIALDDDMYIDIYPVFSSKNITAISELERFNNQAIKPYDLDIVMPQQIYTDQQFKAYVVTLNETLLSGLKPKILELNEELKIIDGSITFSFDRPGEYTVVLGSISKKLIVLQSDNKNSTTNELKNISETSVWKPIDYGLILLMLLIIGFNFLYVLYSVFLGKHKKRKLSERIEKITNHVKQTNMNDKNLDVNKKVITNKIETKDNKEKKKN